VTRDLAAYAELDRAEVVADARDAGRYQKMRRPLVIDDPERPDLVWVPGRSRYRLNVKMLGPRAGLISRRAPPGVELITHFPDAPQVTGIPVGLRAR